MTITKTLLTIIVLASIAVGIGFFVRVPSQALAPVVEDQHVLMGSTTSAGDYHYAEESQYFSIAADYPAKTGLAAEADAKARLIIEQGLKKDIDQFKSDNNVSDRDPEQIADLGIGVDRKFTLDMQYKIFNGQGVTSYLYTAFADSLGAHPNGYYISFVFDQNGTRLALKDLFPNDTNRAYLNKIAAEAQKQVIAELTERLGDSGADVSNSYFSEGLSANDENFSNFVVDGDTLGIFIPPYQAAAYATGTFEVRIPLSSLR